MSNKLDLCDIVRFDSISAELIRRINSKVSRYPGFFLEWVDRTRANFPSSNAAVFRSGVAIDGDLLLDWGSELDKTGVCAFISFHDLTISGALRNSNLDTGPLLFIDGNLAARRIEHGGARTLILGNVDTSGPVLCDYNHGGVRIGGNLTAEVLIVLDQDVYVAGATNAVLLDWNDGGLREQLVAEVFEDLDGDLPSGDLIRDRLARRLPILRSE